MTKRELRVSTRIAGAAAVEFAIVLPLLVLIVGGIIEFGRVFWYYDALTKATRDGARYISTAPKPLDSGVAHQIVADAATMAGLPSFTGSNVSISCDPDCNVPDKIDAGTPPYFVTVSTSGYGVDFGSWFPLSLPSVKWSLTPHTTMRYMCNDSTKSC